jgi:hypothetical protein
MIYRESLRDIEACLRAQQAKLYHMGIRGAVSRNTLANANEKRDWRICADFAEGLIAIARRLYSDDDFAVDLHDTVYALDATTINLCLNIASGDRLNPPIELQASAWRAAILSVTGPCAAMVMGGRGCWTGLGSMAVSFSR